MRDQSTVLQAERVQAVDAIADHVPTPDDRKELLKQVRVIVKAGGPPTSLENERLRRLTTLLADDGDQPDAPIRSPGDRQPRD